MRLIEGFYTVLADEYADYGSVRCNRSHQFALRLAFDHAADHVLALAQLEEALSRGVAAAVADRAHAADQIGLRRALVVVFGEPWWKRGRIR